MLGCPTCMPCPSCSPSIWPGCTSGEQAACCTKVPSGAAAALPQRSSSQHARMSKLRVHCKSSLPDAFVHAGPLLLNPCPTSACCSSPRSDEALTALLWGPACCDCSSAVQAASLPQPHSPCSDEALAALLCRLPRLQVLSLERCTEAGDEALAALAKHVSWKLICICWAW